MKNLLAGSVFNTAAGEVPRGHAGCRRRLRHEAVSLRRIRPGLLGGAPARPPGEMGQRADRGLPVRHPGPRQHHRGRAGAGRGRQVPGAAHHATIANMGAYLSTFAPYIPTDAGTKVLASVYGFKAIYANVIGVFTNTVPVDAYRGAGRPESNYLVERLVDAAARELGIDRDRVAPRNMVPPSAMPYATAVGKTYDSGDFHRPGCGAEEGRLAGFPARRAAAAAKGKRRGLGLAYYLEATGGDPTERAEIRFADDGICRCLCRHPVHRPGARDGLCPAHRQPSSASTATRSASSRATPTHPGRRRHRRRAQPLFRRSGDRENRGPVIEKGKQAAAEELEAAVADIDFRRRHFLDRRHRPRHRYHAARDGQRKQAAAGQPATTLDAAEVAAIDDHTFPNGCHIAEVEIDPDTGVIEVSRYVVWTTSASHQPADRRGQVPAASRRASARRCWNTPSMTRRPASCCPAASWTMPCRGPRTCRTSRSTCWKCPARPTRSASRAPARPGRSAVPPALINAHHRRAARRRRHPSSTCRRRRKPSGRRLPWPGRPGRGGDFRDRSSMLRKGDRPVLPAPFGD